MRTVALITAVFAEVDAQRGALPPPPGPPFAPVGGRGGGRGPPQAWATGPARGGWRVALGLLPRLPARTRLVRLDTTQPDWPQVFLAAPAVLGVIDTSGGEVIRPRREGRRAPQMSRTGLSNHRWMVGSPWCRLLHQWRLMVGWACATARVAATTVQWCMRQAVDGRHHALQHRVKARASLCWVTVGQAFHGALEVGEQHGDLRALVFQSAA